MTGVVNQGRLGLTDPWVPIATVTIFISRRRTWKIPVMFYLTHSEDRYQQARFFLLMNPVNTAGLE